MHGRKRYSPSSAASCARPPPYSHPSLPPCPPFSSRDVSMKYVQLPVEIRGPWTMKGTTGTGLYGVQRRPRYTPGLCVVKLRRHKDTRPLVCNILKPREINYPRALMNYELCLRSWKRLEIFFGIWWASLDFLSHWTLQILVNYYFELNSTISLTMLLLNCW